MNDINKSVSDILIVDEGYRSHPYLDTKNILTIGYGRNLTDSGISSSEAKFMLNNDIAESTKDARRIFNNFDSIAYNKRIVIICMIFNLGLSKYLTFKKMIAAINNKDDNEVVRQMLQSKWHDDVGQRANRLAKLWLKDG